MTAIVLFIAWVTVVTLWLDRVDRRRMERHIADAIAVANGLDR